MNIVKTIEKMRNDDDVVDELKILKIIRKIPSSLLTL